MRRIGDHIFAVWASKKLVKPMVRREERHLIAKVPLADAGRRIFLLLDKVRNGHLVAVESFRIDRIQHTCAMAAAMLVNASRITSCHETGTGRGTDTARAIEACETVPFTGHLVEMRRPMAFVEP